jgi:vancomycin aglycone glucosyltransferase
MRVLLSTCGSRGDVEPMVGLAVWLRALGAEVRVCAPPDFAELLARVGAPLVPVGQPVRPMVHGATPPSAADLPRRAAELVAALFDTVAAVAEEPEWGLRRDARGIHSFSRMGDGGPVRRCDIL